MQLIKTPFLQPRPQGCPIIKKRQKNLGTRLNFPQTFTLSENIEENLRATENMVENNPDAIYTCSKLVKHNQDHSFNEHRRLFF